MKIYNEIAIDMNPESSSYGETLYEDSFEYEGDMMLMQPRGEPYGGSGGGGQGQMHFQNALNAWESQYGMDATAYDPLVHWTIPAPPGYGEDNPMSETYYANNPNYGESMFTYEDDEFAPTQEQFQEYVGATGGYDALETGFGMEAGDLGEFYGKPLEFMKKDFSLGKAGVGLKTGQSLYDIKQGADLQKEKSGFASAGGLAFQEQKKQKGVMADYKQQQKELALGYESGVEEFWRSAYEEMYGDVDIYEEAQTSDRRLKDNITIVDKSPSGINIYTFNYKNPSKYGYGLYRGVMSDDVPSDAVIPGDNGYDLVDYSKLDVNFERILI